MSDPTDEMRLEQISEAFLRMISADAGVLISREEADTTSTDFTIRTGTSPFRRVEIQLKCTAVPRYDKANRHLLFDVPVRNYNELAGEENLLPRLLVVCVVRADPGRWTVLHPTATIGWIVGYWLSLRPLPLSENARSVTVQIPLAHRLSAEELRRIVTHDYRKAASP